MIYRSVDVLQNFHWNFETIEEIKKPEDKKEKQKISRILIAITSAEET